MRFSIFLFFVLLSAGCAVKKQPAAPLDMPLKPTLKVKTYQLEYQTELASPKVKSVQLPAHDILKNQTVRIVADKASLTDTLLSQISQALNDKKLKVTNKKNSDFVLVIQKLDLLFKNDTQYSLKQPDKATELHSTIARQYPVQQCATIFAQVSMRLTHSTSGDVVWFATSSIDSASFHREPLHYSITEEQKITNELEVAAFIHQQNTIEARLERLKKEVSIPEYKTLSKLSSMTKLSGPCNRTEVSALTPMMQYYLSSILIDKIKVK